MKKLVTLALMFLLLAGADASAFRYHPPLREHAAERRALRFLHSYPGWRYREVGYVDCRFGRLNRYTWACRAGWRSGRKCKQGRLRIVNEYTERGVVHYEVTAQFKRC